MSEKFGTIAADTGWRQLARLLPAMRTKPESADDSHDGSISQGDTQRIAVAENQVLDLEFLCFSTIPTDAIHMISMRTKVFPLVFYVLPISAECRIMTSPLS